MTTLPKRGDRVRVTEVAWGDTIPESLVGQELTLEFDLEPLHRTPGFLELPVPYSACRPAAVKVEILERASAKALREAKESTERLVPVSAYQARQLASAEFARGMRRAVEIAESLSAQWHRYGGTRETYWAKLKEAVEKELLE
jgi:hypothetical protein